MTGSGLFKEKDCDPAERPPPGPGFVTVTATVPALVRSLAGTAAESCVLLRKVVTRPAPFQFTTAPLTKLTPLTARLKPLAGITAFVGLILLMVG